MVNINTGRKAVPYSAGQANKLFLHIKIAYLYRILRGGFVYCSTLLDFNSN